jgi:hypothetical protein
MARVASGQGIPKTWRKLFKCVNGDWLKSKNPTTDAMHRQRRRTGDAMRREAEEDWT